jgi:hypothetical protein
LPTDDCFRLEIEHFGQVILGQATPAVPLEDSARWIRVAEQVANHVISGARDLASDVYVSR